MFNTHGSSISMLYHRGAVRLALPKVGPSSTMPPKPSSTAPVWARSFPQACSTTFSPGRKAFTCRNPPPEWNIPPGSRSIRAHPNGTDIPAIVLTTRTALPKTWRPPSTSLPSYPAERPVTSPYRRSAKRKRGASTAGNNNQLKIQRIMQNEDDLRGLAKVMQKHIKMVVIILTFASNK